MPTMTGDEMVEISFRDLATLNAAASLLNLLACGLPIEKVMQYMVTYNITSTALFPATESALAILKGAISEHENNGS